MINFLLFIICFSFSISAYAQNCNYQFDQGRIEVQYNGEELQSYFTMTIDRPQNGSKHISCDRAALFFDQGMSMSYNRRATTFFDNISYTLENTNPTGTLKTFNDQNGPGEYLSVPISPGQSKTVTGLFKVPAQHTTGGEQYYFDFVYVTIYGYQPGLASNQGLTKQLVIGIRTKKTASLSFVDEGGIFDESKSSGILDFGILTQGKTLGKDLIVKSNSSYRLKIGSNNNGRFKHDSQNTYIPYTLNINNNSFNLNNTNGNPREVRYVSNGSLPAGDRYNLRFVIGSVPQTQAFGQYSDYITATIEVQ